MPNTENHDTLTSDHRLHHMCLVKYRLTNRPGFTGICPAAVARGIPQGLVLSPLYVSLFSSFLCFHSFTHNIRLILMKS